MVAVSLKKKVDIVIGQQYINLTVNTNQKPTIVTQKLKRKEQKHTTKIIKPQGNKQKEITEKNLKTTGKQVIKWQ